MSEGPDLERMRKQYGNSTVAIHMHQAKRDVMTLLGALDAADQREAELLAVLANIYRADRTEYHHHEARPWDGQKPDNVTGTRWLTPREMVTTALRQLGANVPDRWDGPE